MRVITDAYLATVGRSVGCPEMWIEDCSQEMRLAMWRAGDEGWRVAKRTAIDFTRKYGPRKRSGAEVVYVELPSSLRCEQDFDTPLLLAAVLRRIACFGPKTQQALAGEGKYNYALRSQARRKLREEFA